MGGTDVRRGLRAGLEVADGHTGRWHTGWPLSGAFSLTRGVVDPANFCAAVAEGLAARARGWRLDRDADQRACRCRGSRSGHQPCHPPSWMGPSSRGAQLADSRSGGSRFCTPRVQPPGRDEPGRGGTSRTENIECDEVLSVRSAVLKTAKSFGASWVRIPPPPHFAGAFGRSHRNEMRCDEPARELSEHSIQVGPA